MAFGGGWQQLAAGGGRWFGGWWRLAVGGWRQLGGWRLVSVGAVLNKKKWGFLGTPCRSPRGCISAPLPPTAFCVGAACALCQTWPCVATSSLQKPSHGCSRSDRPVIKRDYHLQENSTTSTLPPAKTGLVQGEDRASMTSDMGTNLIGAPCDPPTHVSAPHPTPQHRNPQPHCTAPHHSPPHCTAPHLTSPHLTPPHPEVPLYGDVWCAGHKEQACVSTRKSLSVVP